MYAAVTKRDPGPRHQVLYGCGYEHLARHRERSDARAGMHRNAAEPFIRELALSGMQGDPHFQAQAPQFTDRRARATYRSRRTVEDSKHAVVHALDFASTKSHELL